MFHRPPVAKVIPEQLEVGRMPVLARIPLEIEYHHPRNASTKKTIRKRLATGCARAVFFAGGRRELASERRACKKAADETSAACRKGDSGAARTLDPQLRRLLLYPTELRNHRSAAVSRRNAGTKVRKKIEFRPPLRIRFFGDLFCGAEYFAYICRLYSPKG